MLKSVGIKFIAPTAQDSPPAITSLELPVPITLPIQETVIIAREARNVAHLTSPEKTDRVDTQNHPSVTASTTQLSKVCVSEIEKHSIAASQVLTMPPMIAGSQHQPAPTKAPEMGSVKINMNPDAQAKAKDVIQLPPLVASEKTVASKQASDVTEQVAASAPPSLILHVEPNVKKEIQPLQSVGHLGMAVEKAPEPPKPKDAPNLLAKTDLLNEPAATTNSSVVEEPKQVHQHGPSVVRIPSMTLSKKTMVQEPDSEASLEIAHAEVKRSLMTPPHDLPLAVELETELVAKRSVTIAKSEPASLQLPIESTSAVNLPKENKDDHRHLAKNEFDSKTDLESHEPSQVSISKPSTLYKSDSKIVAVPVSAVKESVGLAIDDSLKQGFDGSFDGNGRQAADHGSNTIEVVHRDVRCIKVAGAVEKIEVEDESICKGMVSDSKGITLIGVNRGVTRVKVWMTSESHLSKSPQIFEVSVREAWTTSSHKSGMTINDATKSIAELFPTTRIAIKAHENGTLIVFGKTDTNDEAKKIVSMVRKMFLVPVQDRIAIATP